MTVMEEKLRNQLLEARNQIVELETSLKRLIAPPYSLATILSVKDNMALFSVDGKMLYAEIPGKEKVSSGDVVFANPETGALVQVAKLMKLPGTIGTVYKVLKDGVEVDVEGHRRFVQSSVKVEENDRVVLDAGLSIIYQNLGRADDKHSFTTDTGVSWNDIGGLEDAKQALIEAIEIPYRHKDLYKAYGRKLTKGVLLYGPPGCGKTMLGKATATALAGVHGKKAASGFIYIKGPELLNKWVGESEASVRRLFESAREHYAKHKYPAVIFIDEADALLRGRDMEGWSMSQTIVPMFLAEMDGLEESGAMVLLSTNRPQDLDPAIVRDGRVDRKVRVGRPDRTNTGSIFQLYLKGVPTKENDLHNYAADELFSSSRMMFEISLRGGMKRHMSMYQLSNGGLIAGVVERAKELAMQRDIRAKSGISGVMKKDLKEALDTSMTQMLDLDHRNVVEEVVGDLAQVIGIKKLKPEITA